MIFGRNPVLYVVENLVVFVRKSVEQKLNTLKKSFYRKMSVTTVTLQSHCKNELFLVGELLVNLKGKFTFDCPTKHLKIAEQVSLGVLQHPTKFQVKALRGKEIFCIYGN